MNVIPQTHFQITFKKDRHRFTACLCVCHWRSWKCWRTQRTKLWIEVDDDDNDDHDQDHDDDHDVDDGEENDDDDVGKIFTKQQNTCSVTQYHTAKDSIDKFESASLTCQRDRHDQCRDCGHGAFLNPAMFSSHKLKHVNICHMMLMAKNTVLIQSSWTASTLHRFHAKWIQFVVMLFRQVIKNNVVPFCPRNLFFEAQFQLLSLRF